MLPPSSRLRDALALALLGVAFLVAHQVGLHSITLPNPLAPLWPPSGVLLGGFILLPRRTWRAATATVILAASISSTLAGVRLWLGLGYFSASLIELGVALWIIDRVAGLSVTFRRVRDTFALLAGATLGAAASAVVAAWLTSLTSQARFLASVGTWWTADVLGMLLLTPLIVSWARTPDRVTTPRRPVRALEGVVVLAIWIAAAYRIFRGDVVIGWLAPHPYMLAPIVVWAAFRLGIRGVTAAMTSLALVAVAVVLRAPASFPLGGETLAQRLFLVQVFLAAITVTGLFLASALAEARTATVEAREYAERLKAIGDNIPNGVLYQVVRELDGTRRYLHVSANVERVMGVRAEEVQRDISAMLGLYSADDRARIDAAAEASARDLSVFSVEAPITRPDGATRWIQVSSTPRRLEDGRVVWDGIQSDTTERRESEDRLRRANRALLTVSHCNQVLVRAQTETELLRDICRVIVEDGGYRLAWVGYAGDDDEQHVEPVGHWGYEAGYLEGLEIVWSDTPRGRGPTGTSIRTGQPVVCQDFFSDPTMEPWRADAIARGYRASLVVPLRDGGHVFGALTVYAPEAGAFDEEEIALLAELADDLAYGIMALRSRSEHARAETALAASEERFRQLAENIREVFWMIDARTGHTLYMSPGVERMYGVSAETLVRSPEVGLSLIHPEDRDRIVRTWDTVVAGGEYDHEYRLQRPDGTIHWVHARAFPVRDADGGIYRVVGVTDDITARKRVEDQLRQVQKLEAIGQLAGGVAHDFNNILAAIMMQVGMARALPGLPGDAAELLQDIQASAQRAANLTRQLLVFGRKQVMQERPVELNDLVADLARMLRRVVPEDLQLQLAMHPRALTVKADPGMLEQVIMNLTVNARDAMPGGGVLTIETFTRALSADDVRPFPGVEPGTFNGVRVRDTGSGILPEHRTHIFEPFFTTKEPGKGTGLGLPTVFGIVQQHHGVILMESEVGHGTSFEVLLPALVPGEVRIAAPTAEPLPLPPVMRTILVVEDDASVREMTRRVLERGGYRVHVAHSGREALDRWQGYTPPPDLLLTDLVMPEGVGGVELAAHLQARSPALHVIFTSGYDPDHGTHPVRLEPGVNFLQKPATPRQILDLVGLALGTA